MFIVTSSAFGFSLDIFTFVFTTLVTFSFLISSDRKYLEINHLRKRFGIHFRMFLNHYLKKKYQIIVNKIIKFREKLKMN